MDIPYTVEIRRDTGLTNGKIGIWLFLASEVMLFGALFASYILIRTGAPSWPHGSTILNVPLATFNTIVLIASSVTMVMAWASLMRRDFGKFRLYMGATILLGLMFLGGQVYEFNKLWSEGFHTIVITEPDGKVERIGVAEHHLEEELPHLQEEHPGAQIQDTGRKPVTWTSA